jgi:predicted regulator of Ras-like GTPase activity (Roadblock/LC7/MglB family)
MSLRTTLQRLLDQTDGSLGAIFLDHEGEAVESVTAILSPYEMQVVGAYNGIFLSRLNRICAALDHGSPEGFKIEAEQSSMLVSNLKDGYYLVLVLNKQASEGLAWHQLKLASETLREEI